MKYYKHSYPTQKGDVTEVLSEKQIIADYWEYWFNSMKQAYAKHGSSMYNPPREITEANCIEDWVDIHWATEVLDANELHILNLQNEAT
jgi:hypothetical protein